MKTGLARINDVFTYFQGNDYMCPTLREGTQILVFNTEVSMILSIRHGVHLKCDLFCLWISSLSELINNIILHIDSGIEWKLKLCFIYVSNENIKSLWKRIVENTKRIKSAGRDDRKGRWTW